MKRLGLFAVVLLVLVPGGAWLITLAVPGAEVARAVWTSAAVAVVVQLIGFAFTRTLQPANVMVGWGAGVLLRFVALVIYGFVGVKLLGLSITPALLSLAGFFFVTTLVEPVLLK